MWMIACRERERYNMQRNNLIYSKCEQTSEFEVCETKRRTFLQNHISKHNWYVNMDIVKYYTANDKDVHTTKQIYTYLYIFQWKINCK